MRRVSVTHYSVSPVYTLSTENIALLQFPSHGLSPLIQALEAHFFSCGDPWYNLQWGPRCQALHQVVV